MILVLLIYFQLTNLVFLMVNTTSFTTLFFSHFFLFLFFFFYFGCVSFPTKAHHSTAIRNTQMTQKTKKNKKKVSHFHTVKVHLCGYLTMNMTEIQVFKYFFFRFCFKTIKCIMFGIVNNGQI